jgi:hypothetical protein
MSMTKTAVWSMLPEIQESIDSGEITNRDQLDDLVYNLCILEGWDIFAEEMIEIQEGVVSKLRNTPKYESLIDSFQFNKET